VAAIGLAWAGLVALLLQGSYDTAMGVALFHVVGGVGAAAVWLVARRTESPVIVRIIVAGWLAKMAGTLARFYVLQESYGGSGDANRYANTGTRVAEQLWAGRIESPNPGGQFIGTTFVEFVTGVLFFFTGPSVLGGFVVFSAGGFVGVYLIFRAVRIGCPDLDVRGFALVLFFLPSMVFWPSSLGKETLMLFAIGTFTYGAACLFTNRGQAYPMIVLGCAASALVRPHITLMLVAALVLATTIGRSQRNVGEIPLGKIFKVALAAGLLVWSAVAAGSFLDVDASAGGFGEALDNTGEQTETGGSTFANVNPALYPVTLVTVLFRPFPFEAGNLQAIIASAEGMFLLGLVVKRWRFVWGALRRVRTTPLLVMSLVYLLVFVYAYSSFNNFGLLARQRVQVYPFLVVLLYAGNKVLAREPADPVASPRRTRPPSEPGTRRRVPSSSPAADRVSNTHGRARLG
jgi:hypothetical protein